MKQSILLLFIGIFISCQTSENKTISFLDEGIIKSNNTLQNSISRNMSIFEMRYYENPSRTEDAYKMAKSIYNKLDTIRAIIDDQIYMLGYEHRFIQESFDENNDKLKEKINKYQTLLNNCSKLCDKEVRNQKIIRFRDRKNPSSIIDFNILLNDLQVLAVDILIELEDRIEQEQLSFNKYEPILMTRSDKIRQDENFETKINLGLIDTAMLFKVIIESDTILPVNGKVIYEHRPKTPGTYMIKGIMEIDSIYRYPNRIFPFKFMYKVKN